MIREMKFLKKKKKVFFSVFTIETDQNMTITLIVMILSQVFAYEQISNCMY